MAATGMVTSDANLFEHPEMLVDASAETARVDPQRLADVDKSKGAVVVLGVDPIRRLEKFEALGRIPFGVAITEVASDTVFEKREQKTAFRVRRAPATEQVSVLDWQDVGSLENAGQVVSCF
jgi:hypothetical protein